MDNQFDILTTLFFRIINKFNKIEKKAIDYGIEIKLTPHEVHTLVAIGKDSEINVTQLAQKMGITKSAVSQVVKKLATKKLIIKFSEENSHKEIRLKLRNLGEIVYNKHEQQHLEYYNKIKEHLTSNKSNIDSFLRIFKLIEDELDK
jgi:DNA-binding MarR family transcriptional regulator